MATNINDSTTPNFAPFAIENLAKNMDVFKKRVLLRFSFCYGIIRMSYGKNIPVFPIEIPLSVRAAEVSFIVSAFGSNETLL